MNSKILSFIIRLLFLLSLTSCSFLFPNKAEDIFNKKGIKINKDWRGFYLTQNLPSDSEQLLSFKNDQGEILRVFLFEEHSEKEAILLAKGRSYTIQTLFKDKQVPYEGKISVAESCVNKNKVSASISENGAGFNLEYILMASKEFVYGRCDEEADIYSSKYILQYCKKNKILIEAKIFKKKGSEFHANTPLFLCD